MLVTVPPLNPDIFSKGFHNSHRQNEMKNGSTGDRLVLTLEDDISDEVLKCKSKYTHDSHNFIPVRLVTLVINC